ncbi:succinylglutamate desuccinylase/aspartoacylase domain-containing protein [Candidatus Uabimicrobium amorphum]|uniref:Aspartoacylase n=1 Tax=Uabimicrobium amorphum TaxID=2596890 RepID=A0A5S9F2E6_UABAM|nr:succinylglutamate desuccinylase/aspartoacylase family protein [Candidatus Uabimicrobium amorphum]BBM83585.1 aspartoacylase [Candidatus Uabimicrobium amorphum]
MNKKIEYDTSKQFNRVITHVKSDKEGPIVIAMSGLHGNEPAGVIALEKFGKQLQKINFKGEFVGIAGHLKALSLNKRYINRDLNRIWHMENVEKIRAKSIEEITCPEEKEQKEIIDVLDKILLDKSRKAIFFDLHTTSAQGAPFTLIANEADSRELVANLHVPNILGLAKKLKGTFIYYVYSLGHMIIAYEAGQHEAFDSIDNSSAFLWIMMSNLGLIDPEEAHIAKWQDILAKSSYNLPKYLTIHYHHHIEERDKFTMLPGYRTFQEVEEGEILAKDINGPIRAPLSGRILFPLYQGQGNDGFFIVKTAKQ